MKEWTNSYWWSYLNNKMCIWGTVFGTPFAEYKICFFLRAKVPKSETKLPTSERDPCSLQITEKQSHFSRSTPNAHKRISLKRLRLKPLF